MAYIVCNIGYLRTKADESSRRQVVTGGLINISLFFLFQFNKGCVC